jgi:hypothetical protein
MFSFSWSNLLVNHWLMFDRPPDCWSRPPDRSSAAAGITDVGSAGFPLTAAASPKIEVRDGRRHFAAIITGTSIPQAAASRSVCVSR